MERDRTHHDLFAVQKAYAQHANYVVINNPDYTINECIILFSSNALYFPNDEATASRVLLEENRFEFQQHAPKSFRKIILVRDVFKTWYLKGINASTNNREEVVALLKSLTGNLPITCAGVSAGGYAAMYFGVQLQAKLILSLAGQVSLEPILGNIEDVRKNPSIKPYFDSHPQLASDLTIEMMDFLTKSTFEPIFVHIYPYKSKEDIEQASLLGSLRSCDRFYEIKVNQKFHGIPIFPALFEKFIVSIRDETTLIRFDRNSALSRLRTTILATGFSGETLKILVVAFLFSMRKHLSSFFNRIRNPC
ncbi:MAG: hypothetical protein D4R39_05065 [Methylophilaceae bacterium]|nr:MAG: hypothetical protein D4R39_05065 [Methylophilaceae bacterium]